MAAALDIVGRRASLLLLREAFYGAHRFDDFSRRAQLSEKITATRLRELVGLSHIDCGAPIEVEVRCRKDHPVKAGDIEAALRR